MPRTTTGATSGSSTERARPVIVELIRLLYRYSDRANGRILGASARPTREQLLEGSGASFDSVRDTLDFPDLATIRARWQTIERDTQAFVAALTEADLARVVEYTNMQGERWAYPLWQQMIHQVNHATQHRSEAAVMLTKLGHSPGWLDLLYFVDLVGGPRMAPPPPPPPSPPPATPEGPPTTPPPPPPRARPAAAPRTALPHAACRPPPGPSAIGSRPSRATSCATSASRWRSWSPTIRTSRATRSSSSTSSTRRCPRARRWLPRWRPGRRGSSPARRRTTSPPSRCARGTPTRRSRERPSSSASTSVIRARRRPRWRRAGWWPCHPIRAAASCT